MEPHVVVREIGLSNNADVELLLAMQGDQQEERWGGRDNFSVEQYRGNCADRYDLVRRSFFAEIDGAPAGFMTATMHVEDNTDTVYLGIYVKPVHRESQRGIAGLLAETAKGIAKEEGRPRFESILIEPQSGLNESLRTYVELFTDMGMRESFRLVGRGCPIPVPDKVIQGNKEVGDGYSIITWVDQADEKYLDDIAELFTQLEEDEPSEEADREIERFDAQKVRKNKDRTYALGYSTLTAGALSPEGKLVGFSFFEWHRGEGSTMVTQEETVVHRDQRGHKLGMAMKVATHERVVDYVPDAHHVLTWNAPTNHHLVAINETLGYVPLTTTLVYQTPRSDSE